MRYCKRCLYPETKPHISFDQDGVCNGCRSHDEKQSHAHGIDWELRREQFEELVAEAKARRAPFYDVLVPVSGGKDSITQVHRLLGRGLRIAAVNVDYGIKTEVGERNLRIIPERMGASLVTYRPGMELHRELIRIGFSDFGDPDLLSHALLYSFPLHFARRFAVPLVLLGENSAFEYGGNRSISELGEINRQWFNDYVSHDGCDPRHISGAYGIPMESLALYDFPDGLNQAGVKSVFASYFFFWDSEEHLKIARGYGFETLDGPREGTFRDYVGIDEKINRIHQYMKVLKFGYGRATDHACEEIRNGRLDRERAKELVRRHDLEPLSDYYADDFMKLLGMGREEFEQVLERYRNPEIWRRDARGAWFIPGHLED